MCEIYEETLLLGSEHVNMQRELRTSSLFSILQNVSIRHTEALDMGSDKTLDRGLLWVVVRQHVLISRIPVYNERITVRTWPGDTLHVLFPRSYEILDKNGESLVRASAVWTLIGEESRSFVFPDEHGILIRGVTTGRELPFPTRVKAAPTERSFSFSVPYSYIDLNGHMNNAHYFDLAEDHTAAAAGGKKLREIEIEYMHEVLGTQTLTVGLSETETTCYLSGSQEKPCFRMLLRYDPDAKAAP